MKITSRTLIFLIIAVTPLLDGVNGFFSMYTPGILEQIVPNIRIIFIIIFIYGLFKLNGQSFSITIIIFSFMTVQSFIITYTNGGNIADAMVNFTLVIKLLYFFSLLLYLYELRKVKGNLRELIPYIRFYAYSMPALIIIPSLLGIGRTTYSSSEFGNSGFFIANNASNAALIASMFIILSLYIYQHKFIDILVLFFQMGALFVQGTKTGIAIGIVVIILFVLYKIRFFVTPPNTYRKIIIITLIMFILSEIAILAEYWYPTVNQLFTNYLSPLLSRQEFLSKQLGNDVSTIIFSGRLEFLKDIVDNLVVHNNLINWFFGVGPAYIKNNIGHISEMDGLDVFFDFGILGIMITYGIIGYTLISLWKSKGFILILGSLLLLMYSLLAGHVVVDIISSTALIILIVLVSKDFLTNDIDG